jgi:hypothetical protein
MPPYRLTLANPELADGRYDYLNDMSKDMPSMDGRSNAVSKGGHDTWERSGRST